MRFTTLLMDDSLDNQAQETIDLSAAAGLWRQFTAFVRAHQAEALCCCLLLVMGGNMFAAISRKGITNDEIIHIPAGYYHLVAGEFQINNEHPPLVKMWAALPLLLIQPNESPPTTAEKQGTFNNLSYSYEQRFWQNNQTQFERILFWTRAMMIVLPPYFSKSRWSAAGYSEARYASRSRMVVCATM